MQSRRAEPNTGATLSGTDSFHPELRQIMEVTRNLYKPKRASEEPSQVPSFCRSFGAMPTRPTLPLAFFSLSLPDDRANWVRSLFGSSDIMLMRPVPQVVSDDRKRILENPQQPSSEIIFTRHVPRMISDKGKQVVENPSSRLLFCSSKAKSARLANLCQHAGAPARAPALAA